MAVAVLLTGAGPVSLAQSPRTRVIDNGAEQGQSTGSLVGKLTDLNSNPLEGVLLTLRNQATGAEARATTTKNGAYRFSGLEPGEYTLQAESPELGRGQVEDIEVNAGSEARVQAAMEFEPLPPGPVLAASHDKVPPKVEERPGINQPDLKPAPPPVSGLALAAQPLQTQPANGPLGATREAPAAAAPKPNAAPAAEPSKTMAQAEASQPASAPPKPAVSTPAPAAPTPVAVASAPPVPAASRHQVSEGKPAMSAPAASAPANTVASAVSGLKLESPSAAAPAPPSPGANRSQISEARSGPSAVADAKPVAPTAKETIQTPPHPVVPPPPAAPAPVAKPIPPPLPKPILAASQQSGPAVPAGTTAISAAELQSLPVSGRRWQDFVLDNTPTSVTPAGGQGEISLRGAGQQPPEIAVDGFSRGLAFGSTSGATGTGQSSSGHGPLGQGGEPAEMAQVGAGGHGLAVSEAAIRAVETAAGNVEAAADRAAGGRVNEQTQRGANELHGQGFFFDRQNNWGAKNPFTQWVTETTPATAPTPTGPPTVGTVPVFTPEPYTPPDREMVWGIGVGSRIRHDKLFWFAALDSYNRNDPGLATVKHPDMFFAQPSNDELDMLCARLGLIEPGQTKACTNAAVQALPKYSCMLERLAGTLGGASSDCQLVTPPGPQLGPTSPLLGPAPRTAMQWTGFGRLDWQAAERHRFTLEGIGAYWNSPSGGLTRVSETYGNHSFGSSEASEEWLLGRWEAFLTPNLLAVTQASVGHSNLEARPSTPSDFEKAFLVGNAYGQLPQIVVDNRYGFTIGNPSRFGKGSYPDERLYHLPESVDWIRGKLLVKAGFELNHNFDETSLLRNQTGTYTYSKVENFISDALVFAKYGLAALNVIPSNPDNGWHNCDQTGKVWQDSTGQLEGGGYLPCYSYYSQTIGPADWRLSTNDWAGYATAQWQANKLVVVSAGLRSEREQLPPPIAALSNPGPLLTQKMPSLGNQWGPRVGLAVGTGERHWPVLRLGYGMYFGRTGNAVVETALTQTGSPNGDLNLFIRPIDGFNSPTDTSDAPPFPSVLRPPGPGPGSVIKPGAVEFAPNFHNPEVHQAVVAVEEKLPGSVELTASAMLSLGRRVPISVDSNIDLTATQSITYNVCDETTASGGCVFTGAGPIKSRQITVPFYASWPPTTSATEVAGRTNPNFQQITQIMSRANSTYEAWTLRAVRYSRRGLSLHAHYTYSHAMDWNPNESAEVAGNDILDPCEASSKCTSPWSTYRLEYGTSDLDMRHSAGFMAIYEVPWKLRGRAGKYGNGWMVSGVGQFRGGLPYTMRTSGSLPEEFLPTTNGTDNGTESIVGLGPGMNGSGGDNRIYGKGSDGTPYNIGRNTFRYPATWKADLRLGKRFDLGHSRELELLAESFNLFNHQNVTELETTGYYIESGTPDSPPTLNFLTGLKANTTAFGQPLNINATNLFRERQLQFGLRMRF
ncbi:MAG: carboxypeptidase-like regulatory domain-containing protein [Terracidiphilus sp.]